MASDSANRGGPGDRARAVPIYIALESHDWQLTCSANLSFLSADVAKFRAYDPQVGRWLSRDPLMEVLSGSVNLYSYATNNPVGNLDQLGLKTKFGGGWGSLVACWKKALPATSPLIQMIAALENPAFGTTYTTSSGIWGVGGLTHEASGNVNINDPSHPGSNAPSTDSLEASLNDKKDTPIVIDWLAPGNFYYKPGGRKWDNGQAFAHELFHAYIAYVEGKAADLDHSYKSASGWDYDIMSAEATASGCK